MILVKPSVEVLQAPSGDEVLQLIELAGRTCYKSENKITRESAPKFVNMVLKNGHHSVIEHASMTVRFICDRGVTHELVRHRLAAYSQESTRYCNYSGAMTYVIPPWVSILPGEYSNINILANDHTVDEASLEWAVSMDSAETAYKRLSSMGWAPQQARSVLPNSLKTEIVMTANMREWRHVFSLRCSKKAHPQIREIMLQLLEWCHDNIPILFDDLAEEYLNGV